MLLGVNLPVNSATRTSEVVPLKKMPECTCRRRAGVQAVRDHTPAMYTLCAVFPANLLWTGNRQTQEMSGQGSDKCYDALFRPTASWQRTARSPWPDSSNPAHRCPLLCFLSFIPAQPGSRRQPCDWQCAELQISWWPPHATLWHALCSTHLDAAEGALRDILSSR